jgi:hypothetical protein
MKMHGMSNIKFTSAKQAKAIYNFKDTKEKLCITKAAIWYTSS